MDGAGTTMCKAVNIEGFAVKATYCSMVSVGGECCIVLRFFVDIVCYRVTPRHIKKISRSYILKSAGIETGFLYLLLLHRKKLYWILDFLCFGLWHLVRNSLFCLVNMFAPFFILPWLS